MRPLSFGPFGLGFMRFRRPLLIALTLVVCLSSAVQTVAAPPLELGAELRGARGTYAGQPRQASGRVDQARLLAELDELGVNSYNWLVWQRETDWEDLREFLPAARARGWRVWVTLVPPSESPPKTKAYSEPFRLDYLRWAEEIARLSLVEPALVAWSIDDFAHNLKVFTPAVTLPQRVGESGPQGFQPG